MKELLLGNEAVARGAYEANVRVATGYPGTPSSEIIQSISVNYPDIDSEWSVNEKVALEIAIGGSIAGVRSLATMKHVGLNVAADPLMTAAYTGVNAGLLVVVADDPSMHSSQNEQDTRQYARFAKVPLFEPSDSQDVKDFVKIGMDVSEQYDTLGILRLVTRISHTKAIVEFNEEERRIPNYHYQKNAKKYVMVPAHARLKHPFVLERYERLREFSENFEYNRAEYKSEEIGIITHGTAYLQIKELLPEASVFKVSMYPIPIKKIKDFASKVKKLYVVEELDPVIEEELKMNSIECVGKALVPQVGELTPEIIRKVFNLPVLEPKTDLKNLPPRPPALCAGCGHIAVFEILRDMNVTVLGDIGCYTLGVLTPYNAMDTTICMGASVGTEIGFQKVANLTKTNVRSVGVIGDSTFFHSGMTGVVNAVYNNSPMTLIILDNRITAMTGHQPSPNTGIDLNLNPTHKINLEQVVRGLGVNRVVTVNAYKKDLLKKVVEEEMQVDEPSVIIVQEVCVIVEPTLKKLVKR